MKACCSRTQLQNGYLNQLEVQEELFEEPLNQRSISECDTHCSGATEINCIIAKQEAWQCCNAGRGYVLIKKSGRTYFAKSIMQCRQDTLGRVSSRNFILGGGGGSELVDHV